MLLLCYGAFICASLTVMVHLPVLGQCACDSACDSEGTSEGMNYGLEQTSIET